MRSAWIAVVLLIAGCAGPGQVGTDASDHPVTELAAEATLRADGCRSATVFFLVDYAQAHKHLPAGFQPRDLSGFLYHTPVTSGKVPAFAANTLCEDVRIGTPEGTTEGRMEMLYAGFYVEPPWVEYPNATARVDHDFYTVAFRGPPGPITDLFPLYEWDWKQGVSSIALDVVVDEHLEESPEDEILFGLAAPDRAQVVLASGGGSVDQATDWAYEARAVFPQAFPEPPQLRFWHNGQQGLGFLQFALPNRTVAAGPVDCWIAPGSMLANVTGRADADGTRGPEEDQCGGADSFALAFPPHSLTGSLRHMQGVRAG